MQGQETVHAVVGPLANALPDLRLAVKLLLSAQPWLHDPKVVELPWRADAYDAVLARANTGQGLVFGLLIDDGVVGPHPPVRRAMEEVRNALVAAGHEVGCMVRTVPGTN